MPVRATHGPGVYQAYLGPLEQPLTIACLRCCCLDWIMRQCMQDARLCSMHACCILVAVFPLAACVSVCVLRLVQDLRQECECFPAVDLLQDLLGAGGGGGGAC